MSLLKQYYGKLLIDTSVAINLAHAYKARVEVAGATVYDFEYLKEWLVFLAREKELSNLAISTSPYFANTLSTRYEVRGFDAVQTDNTLQTPIVTNATGLTGKRVYEHAGNLNRAYRGAVATAISTDNTTSYHIVNATGGSFKRHTIHGMEGDTSDNNALNDMTFELTKHANTGSDSMAVYRGNGSLNQASGIPLTNGNEQVYRNGFVVAATGFGGGSCHIQTKNGTTSASFSGYAGLTRKSYIVGSNGTNNFLTGHMADFHQFRTGHTEAKRKKIIDFLREFYGL